MMLAAMIGLTGAWAQAPDPIDLTSTNGTVWTLAEMPAYDVELEVEYYPAATLVDGTDKAPAASADPVYANSSAPLLAAGTASQGTLMYAVTTSSEVPTSTDGFSATIPTTALTKRSISLKTMSSFPMSRRYRPSFRRTSRCWASQPT